MSTSSYKENESCRFKHGYHKTVRFENRNDIFEIKQRPKTIQDYLSLNKLPFIVLAEGLGKQQIG